MTLFEQVLASIEFMESRLRADISMADIAKRAGISTWHFQRLFHQAVGETVGSYLRRRRLAESIEVLRHTPRKVIDIALDFQFGSAEAYSRAFKTEFGFSPKEFREKKIVLVPYRKPALSEDALRFRETGLKLEPVLRRADPFFVVGLRASFVAPLVRRLEYMEDVAAVWQNFMAREGEIPDRQPGIKVGLGDGVGLAPHHIHEDRMDYLACVPVSRMGVIPPGMEAAEVPGGLYAVFEATGYHRQTQLTVDYVYATWLPRSGRRRREGPSYTWVDHRVHPLDPATSKVYFHLPLEEAEEGAT
jgi:AraC family transcriptional regulator